MPVQVRKKVVRIQRDFLWGGVNGSKKLSWVKWKVVCKNKKEGGLGVRRIEVVNLSLLMKWRWRLLNGEESALWKKVLVAKYGIHIVNNVNLSYEPTPYFASIWWKDVRDLEVCGDSPNWLEEAIVRKIGNGMLARFWRDVWIGDSPLCTKFPRLFSLALQKEVCVGELLKVEDDRRWWNFTWRRNLFQWEEDRVKVLENILVNVVLSNDLDVWWWKPNPEEGFSVNSAYNSLVEMGESCSLSEFELNIFSRIWESPAPSKVVAFSWQLLYDRLPTKDNLQRRGILQHGSSVNCGWCELYPESANHLFLHCNTAHRVWYEIFYWLGVVIVMTPNIMSLFGCFCEAAKNKKTRKGFHLVWHTVVWCLWRARNDGIFNGIKKEPLEIVEDIKVLSWKWSVDRLKISPCLFYEWSWDPGECFQN
ncbi:hypothetical protein QL285_000319 [Trifolium repens]|nr:hypothetical protein QL285_000319 [Trifolium repens]